MNEKYLYIYKNQIIMAKIAIDIAILPPEDIMDLAIDLNNSLTNNKRPELILNKTNTLPHASLAMGAIEEEDLPKIKEILDKVQQKYKALELTIIKDSAPAKPNGEKSAVCLDFEKTPELQKLHEHLITAIQPFASYDATTEVFYDYPNVDEVSLFWVNYYLKSSFENLKPHITIGKGDMKLVKYPIKFKATRLALCHLGNYCTCKKILHEIRLD